MDAGLRPYLTRVIDSAIAGYEKPTDGFIEALRLSGATAARTLHVGDLYRADVTGARAAGVDVVMLVPHRDWHDSTANARPTCGTSPGGLPRHR